jgi:hypothetical protein
LNWHNNSNNNTELNCKLIYYTAITDEAHVISDVQQIVCERSVGAAFQKK